MNVRMTRDYTLVELKEEEMKTAAGIILPSDNKSVKVQVGKVLSIGPGRFIAKGKKKVFRPTVVKPDQLVAFSKSVAKKVRINGEFFLVIREDDILGTVDK